MLNPLSIAGSTLGRGVNVGSTAIELRSRQKMRARSGEGCGGAARVLEEVGGGLRSGQAGRGVQSRWRTRNEVMLSELAWIKDCQKKDTLLREVGMAEGFCCRERRKPHMLDEHGLAKHPGTSMQRER